MGRRTKEIAFINNAGGINEAVSPFQMAEDECQSALNVFFTKYDKYGIVSKRKGIDKINAIAMDGKVVSVVQFFIAGVSYLHAFTEAGKAYSVNITTGATTLLQSGLTTTQRYKFATIGDKVFFVNPVDGLYYSTGGVWTTVTDVNKLANPVDVIVYDGRLVTLNATMYKLSAQTDGTDWTSDSWSAGIDEDDGDVCTALATIGKQLIAFKRFSVHRIVYTGDDLIPYRRESQYSGRMGSGIGCNSRLSIQNVTLDNLYSDVWGKAEYVLFASDMGIHAIGLQGNPINIDQRVRNTYLGIQKDRIPYVFSVTHPKRDQYMFFFPEGSKTSSSSQLVFSTKAKAWSKYNWTNMSSACLYVDVKVVYTIMGDKNGYLYKHDYQETDSLTDYSDDGEAIQAYWQSQYYDFGLPNRYKQIYSTTVRVRETETDCPVTILVTGEDGTSATGTISTTGSGSSGGRYDSAIIGTGVFASALGYIDHDVDVSLYCYNASYRFENAVNEQSMDIYGWFTEVKGSQNKGVRS